MNDLKKRGLQQEDKPNWLHAVCFIIVFFSLLFLVWG